jgi:tight adherence protein C
LADVLETISKTIRERIQLKGQIRALTSQQQMTGTLLSALPFVMGTILFLVSPDYMSDILKPGWPMLLPIMITRGSTSKALMFTAGAFLIGLYLPNMWLNSKAQARQKAIARALPDTLDMMSICVDAGLGFEAALQKVAFQSDGELAMEMRRVISEIRVGVARADALRHLAERTQVSDVASFVAVLVQADRLGIAIRNVLNTQSIQMRILRRQRAEEEAGKAPIKMLIPLAIFIFPAMFAVILGPAVPRVLASFGHK